MLLWLCSGKTTLSCNWAGSLSVYQLRRPCCCNGNKVIFAASASSPKGFSAVLLFFLLFSIATFNSTCSSHIVQLLILCSSARWNPQEESCKVPKGSIWFHFQGTLKKKQKQNHNGVISGHFAPPSLRSALYQTLSVSHLIKVFTSQHMFSGIARCSYPVQCKWQPIIDTHRPALVTCSS